jgi:hypothetical protein
MAKAKKTQSLFRGLADGLENLLGANLERKRAASDVNRPASNAVNNLRDLGFDFTAVVETGEDCGADLNLFGH